MSQTPSMMDPHWLPPEPPRSGCGKKLVMGLGCGCFLMVLCCCGGGFGLFWWVQKGVITEPAAIQAATQEIAQLEIPADLQPKGAMRLNAPFGTQTLLLGVVYQDSAADSMLMLGTGAFLNESTADAVRQGLLRDAPDQREHPLVNRKSEQRAVTIKGEPSRFSFTTGEDAQTKQPRIEVHGLFAGKTAPALFFFIGNAEKYPPAKVQALLQSIK